MIFLPPYRLPKMIFLHNSILHPMNYVAETASINNLPENESIYLYLFKGTVVGYAASNER